MKKDSIVKGTSSTVKTRRDNSDSTNLSILQSSLFNPRGEEGEILEPDLPGVMMIDEGGRIFAMSYKVSELFGIGVNLIGIFS